jgi:signal transduction histidine kinase
VYTGYRLRMRQLLQLERVRTRIATDLHDDLGGSLTRMIILSEVVRRQAGASREDTVKRMGQIADTARSLVDALSDAVWAIDARSDTLSALITRLRAYASDLFDARRTACIFDAPPDLNDVHLSPDVRRHLFLIVKEALTNVARHAEASRVEVRLTRAGRHLTIDVVDNGRGDSLPCPAVDQPTRGGRGRANMQARAALLGGRVEISANAGGTRVHVAVILR